MYLSWKSLKVLKFLASFSKSGKLRNLSVDHRKSWNVFSWKECRSCSLLKVNIKLLKWLQVSKFVSLQIQCLLICIIVLILLEYTLFHCLGPRNYRVFVCKVNLGRWKTSLQSVNKHFKIKQCMYKTSLKILFTCGTASKIYFLCDMKSSKK